MSRLLGTGMDSLMKLNLKTQQQVEDEKLISKFEPWVEDLLERAEFRANKRADINLLKECEKLESIVIKNLTINSRGVYA